jgi:hypothetical protein
VSHRREFCLLFRIIFLWIFLFLLGFFLAVCLLFLIFVQYSIYIQPFLWNRCRPDFTCPAAEGKECQPLGDVWTAHTRFTYCCPKPGFSPAPGKEEKGKNGGGKKHNNRADSSASSSTSTSYEDEQLGKERKGLPPYTFLLFYSGQSNS